jgi:excisionase family DNA binding protein
MAVEVQRRALLTKREVSQRLRVSERTVDRWRRLGLIGAVQPLPGGAVRFRREDVEQLERSETRLLLPAREDELEWS